MPGTMRILAWVGGVLIALAAVVVALVLAVANTDRGRRLLEVAIARLSGGQVVLTGISGQFPDHLRVARAELSDADSIWLSADDIALQWSPAALASRQLRVQMLRVGRVRLLRLPGPATPRRQAPAPSDLPVSVDVAEIEIDELDIGAALAGAAASVRIHGNARAASLQQAQAALTVNRLDAPGSYRFSGRIDPAFVKVDLDLNEPPQGLLAGLAQLSDLGALSVQASIEGPRNAPAMRLAVTAGPLRASGMGGLDLIGRVINLDVTASAPAMAPRQDISWKQFSLQAHVHGPFRSPDARGQVRIDGLDAGAVQLRTFSADFHGARGRIDLRAVLAGLRIPGPKPDLLQAVPIDLRADVTLDDPRRPVNFAMSHPLVSMLGTANTAGALSANLTISTSALAPLADMAGVDLKGHATVKASIAADDQSTKVELSGVIGVTAGAAPLPALIGESARLAVSARFHAGDLAIERAQLDGRTARVSVDGSVKRGVADLNWKMALSDLSAVASTFSGRMQADGRIEGVRGRLILAAGASGDVGTEGFPPAPFKAKARLTGLPGAPAGRVEARGSVDGSPLELVLTLQQGGDGSLSARIERADWKSAHAEGSVALRAIDRLPQGRLAIRVAQLSDLQAWIGKGVQGSVVANVDVARSAGHSVAMIELDARNAAFGETRIDHLTVAGRVADPTTRASLALQIAADRIVPNGTTGITAKARLLADGPLEALVLKLSSDFQDIGEAETHITATAILDVPARQASLSALQAQYKDQTARLLAPARVAFADGLVVDRLRIGAQQAALELAGRLWPTLDLTASLRNVTPALVRPLVPDLQAEGTVGLEARLTGTLAQPRGTVRINGEGLRLRAGAGPSLPSATLLANADLDGQFARIDVRLLGGTQVRLHASGRLPLSMAGSIDMHADGTVDAAIANPVLEVDGRRVKGQISLDFELGGNFAAPQIDGTAKLIEGEIEDYTLGAHLTEVRAQVQATGHTVRIVSASARAGAGTVSASGTVGLLQGHPVDVRLTARNARALASDLLTADTDLDLSLHGLAATRLEVTGRIAIDHAQINIPNALPSTIAVLDVRRPGQKAAALASAPAMVIGLDLVIDAPQRVIVRGRGLDAEAGGELRVTGTSAAPQFGGGFEMRRGTFDLGGTSLKFTSGKVSFNGTGITQKIDPTLDFEAESTAGGITAKLAVTGYADAPVIVLTSAPVLPQDEILARLLFGTNVKQLTTLQIIQIGTALVSLSGSGGASNPLLAAQKTLGLDRLSVGSAATGGTSVEAGRYVSSNVYVGAKQSTSGSTQAKVQVDLTKHLKAQATLGNAGATAQGITPDNDPGSSVGLSYQFEY
jgi:translocation and assembly module TamB